MGKRGSLALAFVLILLAAADAFAVTDESRLMRYPDICGDLIVFTYGGDIWTVPSTGGTATHLTTHTGGEGFAKFSPDGKTIAFTGTYDGNADIYTIPATGGVPKRLTYHSFPDFMVEWHPKGDRILFRSYRESKTNPGPRYMRLYTIGTGGGYPEALPLFEGELTSYSPDGTKIAYNRMSREFRTWKRYKGGMAQDIWLYDLAKNESAKLTEYEGTDAFPMWHGDKIYFISDRDYTMNIYSLDLETREITKITNHREYDVKWPSIGGDSIVYENGGYLYVLDLNTGKSNRIKVTVPSDQTWLRPRYVDASSQIRYFNLSSTGKRAIFGARGDIFTVPAEKGEVRNLTNSSGVRERSPAYSPDGKWVAYLSDRSGEYEIYMMKSDGTGEEQQITKGQGHYPWVIFWSPDSKKILFHDETYQLYYVDIEAKKVVVIDKDPLADIGSYSWSGDSKWVAYAKNNDLGYGSIYLYNIDEDRTHKVTGDMYNDYNPVFDPGGKYLYFISDRAMNFSFHNFEFDVKYEAPSVICAVTLKADTPSLLAPESDEVEVKEDAKKDSSDAEKKDEEKPGEKGDDKKKDGEKDEKADEEKALEIDLDGFDARTIVIPVGSGNFAGLVGLEGKLLYAEFTQPAITFGPPNGSVQGSVSYWDLKDRESKNVISGITGYDVSADGKKLIYSARGQYGIIDIAPGKKVGDGKLNAQELRMKLDPREEWKQIFYEAWRMERDFFYVENMHGLDWDKIKKRYEELLPYLTTRDDLNYVIGEMIAEMNVGHSYVGGGERYPMYETVSNGKLGCDFEVDKKSGRYRIAKIYKGRNWEPLFVAPLNQPGLDIREGDFLMAINGVDLKYPVNPFSLLDNTAGHQTVLKISREADGKDSKDVTVVPVSSDINLRYEDWVEGNRQKCLATSGGKVGYVHVPSTAVTGLYEFGRQYFPQADMDGIVIDVRYNSGGWMPSLFVDRLGKELKSLWATRYGIVTRFPMAAPVGYLACVINEYAGSGGDAFPYMFRQAGLGPLIGKRTWGGLVGMNRNVPMVDGGYVTVPTIGFVNTDGEYDVEGYGVAPDIEVENMPDLVVSGRDPQLEKAIEYLMGKIAEDPPKHVWKKPADPDKN